MKRRSSRGTILALRSTRGPSLYLYSPECVEVEFCEVRAATTTALPNGASLFALFFVRLQDHRRAVPKVDFGHSGRVAERISQPFHELPGDFYRLAGRRRPAKSPLGGP